MNGVTLFLKLWNVILRKILIKYFKIVFYNTELKHIRPFHDIHGINEINGAAITMTVQIVSFFCL
jgi:hypothetical protein